MPPKKNVKKTEVVQIIPKDKVPRGRIKKEKPKLKTPTVLKVKIPALKKNNVPAAETSPKKTKPPNKKKLILDSTNEGQIAKKDNVPAAETSQDSSGVVGLGSPKPPTKRKLMLDRTNEGHIANKDNMPAAETSPGLYKPPTERILMLDRTNEVARAQLVKGSPVTETNVVKKKRGRKKKIQEVEPGSDAKEETPPIKKKTVPEVPAKMEVIKKNKAAVPKKKNTEPVIKRQIKSKAVKADSTIVKRKSTRGKATANDDETTITSPSILSQGLLDRKPSNRDIQNQVKPVESEKSNVNSRRTSVNSASEWSWTKDISGSSTTTCITVCSNDIVRIDKKLPVVKLHNIDCGLRKVKALREKIEGEHSLSEDSTSSSSSSTSSDSSSNCSTVNNSLNLSTSSLSPSKPRSPTYTSVNTRNTSVDTICTPVNAKSSEKNLSAGTTNGILSSTLEKLTSKLKSFDLEIWSDDEDDDFLNMKAFEVNMFKVMEEEQGALLECNFLSRILSEKCFLSKEIADVPLEPVEVDFAKPDASVIASKPAGDLRNENSFESGRRRDSMSFDDDDDALSIFAESITGIESSRVSSSASMVCGAAPAIVEYIPQPLRRDTWAPVVPRHYQPTKITEELTPKTKPVCEKQNADSTSIQKELELPDPSLNSDSVVPVSKVTEVQKSSDVAAAWGARRQQPLTISHFEPPYGMKCTILRGACFFNLISNCKKANCLYPHVQIEEAQVANRLKTQSENQFLREFMHIARWSSLRMRYSKCFLKECQRRELPKFLVEMVIVYINRTNTNSLEDSAMKVDIIECALLYLNVVNLSVCENLLKYKFSDGKFLCDVFMETIADTQNFWRFKNVFMNLAGFMVRARRTFKLEVATQILERVCIFPFELPLALVILSILQNTDKKIFENSMMRIFEKQLQTFSKELHEKFLVIKSQSGSALSAADLSQEESPAVSQEVAPLSRELSLSQTDCEKRYTSPDTTNLDSLNKPVVEPVIRRTVNLDKIRVLASNTEGNLDNCKVLYPNWNQRTIYDKIPRLASLRGSFGQHLRPRPLLKRPIGRQVLYGPRQFKFPRRFDPEHYGNQ